MLIGVIHILTKHTSFSRLSGSISRRSTNWSFWSNGQGTQDDTDIAVNTYAWNKTLQKALGAGGIAEKC